jgi:hypothetical protein
MNDLSCEKKKKLPLAPDASPALNTDILFKEVSKDSATVLGEIPSACLNEAKFWMKYPVTFTFLSRTSSSYSWRSKIWFLSSGKFGSFMN